MTFLTAEEREKFAAYLEESMRSDLAIIGLLDLQHPLRKRLNAESMAAEIIAKKLRATESSSDLVVEERTTRQVK